MWTSIPRILQLCIGKDWKRHCKGRVAQRLLYQENTLRTSSNIASQRSFFFNKCNVGALFQRHFRCTNPIRQTRPRHKLHRKAIIMGSCKSDFAIPPPPCSSDLGMSQSETHPNVISLFWTLKCFSSLTCISPSRSFFLIATVSYKVQGWKEAQVLCLSERWHLALKGCCNLKILSWENVWASSWCWFSLPLFTVVTYW